MLLVAYLVLTAACGGPAPGASVVATPPPSREMKIAMSGALTGAYQVIDEPDVSQCAAPMSGDRGSINYILNGHVEGVGPDVGVQLQFGVEHHSSAGTYRVGPYPGGSSGFPAVVSVVREITPRNIVSWISGSGALVIDRGMRSGTLDVSLTSPTGQGDLSIAGSWLCSRV